MSIFDGDNERKPKTNKGHNSAEHYSTRPYLQVELRILVTNLCTKFYLTISTFDRDDERTLNPEGRNDGRMERGNTICPGHFMTGHKKCYCTTFCNKLGLRPENLQRLQKFRVIVIR